MVKLLKFLLTYKIKSSQHTHKSSGFTLLELLVGLVLAFLIITPLLGFAINILTTDRQEQAKAKSEQEIQAALDYMARDLEQAVFIYDGQGLGRIKNQLPQVSNGASGEPVLVFWKRKFLPKSLPPENVANCSNPRDCDDAFVYSLVAYYLIKQDPGSCTGSSSPWSCAMRIGRTELRQGLKNVNNPGSDPNWVQGQEPSPGFQLFDLSGSGTLESKMNNWRNSGNVNSNSIEILIDYIDQTPETTAGVPPASCPNTPRDPNADPTPYTNRQVPASTSGDFQTGSFYACVDTDKTIAKVFIRGNALARLKPKTQTPTYNASNPSYFPRSSIQAQGLGLIQSGQSTQ